MPQGELMLNQTYQMVAGTLKSANGVAPIANGKLNGDQITFTAGGTEYSGRVVGNTIEGASKGNGSWKATRISK
jgi:triacylglycerol esterase/lipase EstA (alpha/beta hydrolase family)